MRLGCGVTAVARQVPRLAGLVRFPAGWRVQAAIRQQASWLAYPSNCFGTSGNIIKQGMLSNPSESIPCFFIFWLVFENNSDCSASRGTRRATVVKPRPTRMSPYAPARQSRAEMGAGHRPARPASREACHRAAVKPRPTRMFPTSLRGIAAQKWVQGIALPDPRAARPVAERR